MKHLALALSLAAALSASAAEDKVVRRGEPLSHEAKVVTLADVTAKPEAYTKVPVIVEGTIRKSCTIEGCWMELGTKDAALRVTLKEGVFIPLDAKSMEARAQGVAIVKTLTKEEADHLAGEGATVHRQSDGTAKEVSFEATGVELRKK